MYEVPNHPVVENLLRTGYPDGREPEDIICPACGTDSETFYVTANDGTTVVGCENCLIPRSYWEFEDGFRKNFLKKQKSLGKRLDKDSI